MFTHTPLCHSLSHMPFLPPAPLTHPQEVLHLSMSECERAVEIGCKFCFFDRKAIIVGFVIGFASHLLVTRRFLLMLCLQPSGLI